ncbi:MAG: helix-turn-helix transcriptional regulator [Pedobacter sp.]|uniref:AraC family transcriptional regulator n=1 Tax=Pedobacter sp. TaxID=1411316 RepID=UPI00339A92AD
MNSIPIDQLKNKTNAGLQIKIFSRDDSYDNLPGFAHRDDHYIFFLLKSGSGSLKIDSQDVVIGGGSLYYILPSQVHYRIQVDKAEGWFLAIDPSLILPGLREAFERGPDLQLPCKLSDDELKQFAVLLDLLHEEFVNRQGAKYYLQIIHSLLQSFLAMSASIYDKVEKVPHTDNRSAELTRQFKELLTAHVQTIKSPSMYASMLNVSTGYLNEVIKKVTGSTVSYWIGQELFIEAKRLLNHTDAGVKEIAHQLGYSDQAYFIRSFRKMAGSSPLKYKKLTKK